MNRRRKRVPLRFGFSYKQPRPFPLAALPSPSLAQVLAGQGEGRSAPKGARAAFRHPLAAVRRAGSGGASPFGALLRRFVSGGSCFRDRTGAVASLIRRAFARFHPVLVQPSERQSSVVSPDDDPRPPECARDRLPLARRRRLPAPRIKASQDTPLK